MLLGLYERELTSIIEQVIGGRWSRFIDLGCAQGYYAVGIALKAGSTVAVIAFDSDPKIVVEARRKAAANKVEDRIVWKGAANAEELERLKLGGQDLLFVDIEGYERELLDPKRIPSLTGCDILVESHDFMYPGTSKLLRERFQASHSITEITWKPVPLEEIPFPESGNAHSLCVNGRPDISWMWMQVREKSSDGKPR